jgi:hypothetical protein
MRTCGTKETKMAAGYENDEYQMSIHLTGTQVKSQQFSSFWELQCSLCPVQFHFVQNMIKLERVNNFLK